MDSIAEHLPARGAGSAGCPGTHAGELLGRGRQTYVRRQPEQSVLHRVVREHLETFLAEARYRGGGEGLPRFVERELREFLTCGVMARGFARFRCDGCAREILVAFSCKGRGFCPSCCGRRMGELAAHLVDGVLGGLPVRQWVLTTLPFRLRYRLAYDHRLCRAVLGVFVRALLRFEERRARVLGVRGRAGAVTAIQRCGLALNVNPHFHTLVAEGVFEEQRDGSQRFVPLREPPTDVEVARLLAALRSGVEPGPERYVTVGYAVPSLVHDARAGAVFLVDGAHERTGAYAFDAASGARLNAAALPGWPTDLLLLRAQ